MRRDEAIEELLRCEPVWRAVGQGVGPTLAVEGPVVLLGGTGKAYRYRVRIDIPREFPARDAYPDVWVLESPFPFSADAHVDADGNMCLELPRAHEIDYERVGLVGVLQQVVFHLDRLRIHALTGRFPGPQYDHGDGGVRQFLRERHAQITRGLPPSVARLVLPAMPMPPDRQWCPCGAKQRFGSCHKEAVKAARRELAPAGPFPRTHLKGRPRNPFTSK